MKVKNAKTLNLFLSAMKNDFFSTEIEYLKGVGPQRADMLKKELNIFTFGDLLHHFPFRYVDRTSFYKIKDLNPQTQYIQIAGKVVERNVLGQQRNKRFIACFADETGEIELVWFQSLRWAEKAIELG